MPLRGKIVTILAIRRAWLAITAVFFALLATALWAADKGGITPLAAGPSTPSYISYPTSSSNGNASITWGLSTGATYYSLERSKDGGAYGNAVTFTSPSGSVSGLANGSYKFRVRGCDDATCGLFRTGTTTLVVSIPAPTATVSAVATTIGYGQSTTINWSSTSTTSCTLNGASAAVSGSQSTGALYSSKSYALSCTGAGGSANSNVTVTVVPVVVISSFTASPTAIAVNGSSTLTWATSNATSCTINGSSVALSGSAVYSSIASTTNYTLACTNINGTVSSAVTVTVVPVPTVSLSANPTAIPINGSSTLTWSSTNASSCTINGSAVALSGNQLYSSISATTTYTFSCSGTGGNASTQATVTTVPVPTVTISASPTAIAVGGNSTITWNSTNATSCTLNGSSVALTGNQVFSSIAATTTYTLACSGVGGSKSAQTTVTVVPVPTVSISASPTTIASGESSTLTWSSTNATSCTINSSSVAVSGSSVKTNITATTTYTLACFGVGGNKSGQVTVTVAPVPSVTFSVDATLIETGTSTTLRWTSSGATSCNLNSQVVGTAGPQFTGNLSTNQTYSLTCTGIGGTSQARTVSVTVAQAWANVGTCDPTIGKQTQLCVHGSLCTLNSTRQVAACGVSNVGCSN